MRIFVVSGVLLFQSSGLAVSQAITEFALPGGPARTITAGPDGNLWFVETSANKIGKITVNGSVTEYMGPPTGADLYDIVAGPDGNLWFTRYFSNKIGRITVNGVITQFPFAPCTFPGGIARGSDGNLWIG